MSRDLEQTGANIVAELVCDHSTLDELDDLRDAVSECVYEAADSAVTYYDWAQEIIDEYENHPATDCDSADGYGDIFLPSQYREAMKAYALWIARGVIEHAASEVIDTIEESADALREECAKLGVAPDDNDIRITADCPHGWAAHDRETDTGACLWVSRQLDGCNSVAIKSGPVWLSYTYEPQRVAA